MDRLIVEDLGKRYFVASKRALTTPPPRLNIGITKLPLPRLRLPGALPGRELWALHHVSFTVPEGQVLGIIGPNGAGKSTLLKMLARVTRPTEGRITGFGRVVSLLELGAGFNPDFSATDNVLMNAAMHGIPRREALERMDDIIAFAELDEFVDNPLRQYSSGMYLRLAFSVAINMQPDILLADEILAVGDMAFQERCLQRVAQEAERGLAVLFVSHDMSAIARLCDRVIWLDKGEVVKNGDPEPVIAKYEEAALRAKFSGDRTGRHTSIYAEIDSVRLLNAGGDEIGAAPAYDDVCVRIRVRVRKPGTFLRAAVDVIAKGAFLFRSTQPDETQVNDLGACDLLMHIPRHLLGETTYLLNVTVNTRLDKETKIVLNNALTFMVYGDEAEPGEHRKVRSGLIAPKLEWQSRFHEDARRKRKSAV